MNNCCVFRHDSPISSCLWRIDHISHPKWPLPPFLIDCCIGFVQSCGLSQPYCCIRRRFVLSSHRPSPFTCGQLVLQMSAALTPPAPSPVAKTFMMVAVGFERGWTANWRLPAMVGVIGRHGCKCLVVVNCRALFASTQNILIPLRRN